MKMVNQNKRNKAVNQELLLVEKREKRMAQAAMVSVVKGISPTTSNTRAHRGFLAMAMEICKSVKVNSRSRASPTANTILRSFSPRLYILA